MPLCLDAYYYYGAAGRAYGDDAARGGSDRPRVADSGSGFSSTAGRERGRTVEPDGVSGIRAPSVIAPAGAVELDEDEA